MSARATKNKERIFEVRITIVPDSFIDNQRAADACISTWNSIVPCLSRWVLDFGFGEMEFTGDWSSVATAAISSHNESVRFWKATTKEEAEQFLNEHGKYADEEIHTIKVCLRGSREILSQGDDFLRMYLMNCFLALNLSAPGCARMSAEFKGRHSVEKIELYELNWFSVWYEVWPVIYGTPLSETMKWLTDVHFGKGLLAETSIQRLLIALLRVSDGEMWGPEHVLWLSQALEAIVDSPVERLTSTLQQRLLALLGAPHSVKNVKKKISGFYALRSRITHGDFQFIHPVANEIIDYRIESIYEELRRTVNFGMAMLVAIAQMLVCKKWKGISFFEEIRGIE